MRCSKRTVMAAFGIAGVLSATGLVAGGPSTSAAAAGATTDYFVESNTDPMDFGNTEDLALDTEEGMFVGGTNKSISGGQLHFDAAGAFQFDPVWAGYPTGIPHYRDGGRYPIDTTKFKRFVIRMNAPEGAPVGLRWFNCLAQTAACQGGQAWFARGGWQTYDITLGDDGTVPGLAQNWTSSRSMFGLRMVGTVSGHFDIDWIRLTGDSGAVEEIVGGPASDMLPTGTDDFATAVVGNPWDMNPITGRARPGGLVTPDIVRIDKIARPAVANNRFSGCSLDTRKADSAGVMHSLSEYLDPSIPSSVKEDWYLTHQEPGITLNQGKFAIDANKFRWLTFEYSYEKSTAAKGEGATRNPPMPLFGTKPVPGGGANARVFWSNASGRHPTMSIHLYPHLSAVTIDLQHPLAMFQGLEKNTGKATGSPWGGPVSVLRINPNDTRDGRCFTIGRVWLTAQPPAGLPQPPADLPLPRVGSGVSTPGGS